MYKINDINIFDDRFCNLMLDYIDATRIVKDDLPDLTDIYLEKITFELLNNIKLKEFIKDFESLDYISKINAFNCFAYLNSDKNDVIENKYLINNFLENNIKMSKMQINFISLKDFKIPFDNLYLFSLFTVYKIQQNTNLFDYLNSINNNIIDESIKTQLNKTFKNVNLEFNVYSKINEINDNLIKTQFLKSKNEFKLSYGIFSNVINSKINVKNLNTISEIDLYVENNKSNSFILQIENNSREIYKIVKNHSFIKWILSEDVIIKSKKYLFDSKYWIKLFELVFELLPFKIDEKDKEIEIIYDENNFQVQEIKWN